MELEAQAQPAWYALGLETREIPAAADPNLIIASDISVWLA